MADDLEDAWWEKSKKKSSKSDEQQSDEENSKKKKKSKEVERNKDKSREKHKSKEKEKKKEKRKKDSEDSDSEPSSKKKKDSDSDGSKKKSKEDSGSESESEEEEEVMGTTDELLDKLRRQFFGLLTPVEEDEMEIPSSSFSPCRQAGESQTGYLSNQVSDWEKKVTSHKRKGAPIVLIVCASGIRCVNLKRELASFLGKNCKTAKLFSKHMKVSVKIEEQEKYLKSHVVHLGVGTPHRLKSLIESEALSLSELTHIFVDWNWRDQKKRRLADVSEARCELNNLLKAYIIPHLRKRRQVKLGLL